MSTELLIRCCAPTLAGMKTGSMYSCPCADRETLLRELQGMNRLLSPKGLCILPLRFEEERALPPLGNLSVNDSQPTMFWPMSSTVSPAGVWMTSTGLMRSCTVMGGESLGQSRS